MVLWIISILQPLEVGTLIFPVIELWKLRHRGFN